MTQNLYTLEEMNSIDLSLFKIVGNKVEEAEKINNKPYSYWKSVFSRVIRSKTFLISLILLVIIILMSATIGIGAEPVPVNPPSVNIEAPSKEHIFGLGRFGEDLWTKMWIGTRTTLIFTLIVASIQILLGILIGSIWGYYRKLDIAFIEVTRFMTLIPSLILWLIIIFLFGGVSTLPIIIFAISLTSWISLASIIRVQIIIIRNAEYNIASKVLGTPNYKIIKKNILPKILPIIIQTSTFAIPTAIGLDSLLAYYNFGFVTNTLDQASLGSILNELLLGSDWEVFPHLLIIPVLFVGGISLLFFLAGKVFADSLDPKTHR
ncbi:oligopeptide ABC transporter permease OppC [Spiroplasma turonicum]|uniref:Oligopeptide ABC transporter permease n=1 Tax=Spiroplasma turonicum TaxID=216946 RepID=A0A0K1P5C7_9MOLU|nr:oligopeptide ABC transporter permease OppC [Spiroplasma turonicum]AKU79485.1 oligopeptide ABC transporter permease [Spiroplasma turonicum]ALX70506.1 oligopeptide ABC transporter permease [Spiroplasma turonicum]